MTTNHVVSHPHVSAYSVLFCGSQQLSGPRRAQNPLYLYFWDITYLLRSHDISGHVINSHLWVGVGGEGLD